MPDALFDNYDRCGVANGRAEKLVGRARAHGPGARMAFYTADVASLTAAQLGAYDVVFLAALVGMASREKADAVAHLGKHMAVHVDGAM